MFLSGEAVKFSPWGCSSSVKHSGKAQKWGNDVGWTIILSFLGETHLHFVTLTFRFLSLQIDLLFCALFPASLISIFLMRRQLRKIRRLIPTRKKLESLSTASSIAAAARRLGHRKDIYCLLPCFLPGNMKLHPHPHGSYLVLMHKLVLSAAAKLC